MSETSTEKRKMSKAEAGRLGGMAPRKRRETDPGVIVWNVYAEDPEAIARRVFSSSNGMAIVELIKYGTEAKTRSLRARDQELEEREKAVRERAARGRAA